MSTTLMNSHYIWFKYLWCPEEKSSCITSSSKFSTRWIGTNFCTDIYASQTVYLNDFGDP